MADNHSPPPNVPAPFDDSKYSRKELSEQWVSRKSAAKRRPVVVIDPGEAGSLLVGSQATYLTDEGVDKLWTIFMVLMKQRARRFPTSEKSDCVSASEIHSMVLRKRPSPQFRCSPLTIFYALLTDDFSFGKLVEVAHSLAREA